MPQANPLSIPTNDLAKNDLIRLAFYALDAASNLEDLGISVDFDIRELQAISSQVERVEDLPPQEQFQLGIDLL